MLIVSKYKDYYDNIAYSKGIDKSIVFNRQLIEFKDFELSKNRQWYDHLPTYSSRTRPFTNVKGDIVLSVSIVGFCGKLYHMCKKIERINQYDD